MAFASHTVHVISDASARPIITAFTTTWAAVNMPQGDRSRGSAGAATGDGAGFGFIGIAAAEGSISRKRAAAVFATEAT